MSNVSFERNPVPELEFKQGQFFRRGDEIYISCLIKGDIFLVCLNDGFLWDENPCYELPLEFTRIFDGTIKIEV